jgi:polyphosphate kinase
LLMIPATLPRFVRLPGAPGGKGARYMAIEAIVRRHLSLLFPGYRVRGDGAFRIIRDSDIEIEEEAEDLVRFFRTAIKRRRRGRVIRLKFEANTPDALVALVREGLDARDALVSESTGFVGIADLGILVDEDRPDLKFPPYTPRFPERIREHGGDCFAAIGAKDIVVHHPYESFDVVLAFLRQGAEDPDVVAIKQTLYRAGKQSAVVDALVAAAEAGKSVTAVVELKARFDEEQNLLWANRLERAGVQVVYGFIDWKTHAKVSMVVRREAGAFPHLLPLRHRQLPSVTARIYTDISFFTADPRAGRDATAIVQLHHRLCRTGRARASHHLTPWASRPACRADRTGDRQRAADRPAAIWAKMNSLGRSGDHREPVRRQRRGVEIDLIIRGICCLRPGIAGLSETIRVKSVVGRFLEHSRIWAFGNGERCPTRTPRCSSRLPTGCRATSTGASNICCRSATPPAMRRSWTRSWWPA